MLILLLGPRPSLSSVSSQYFINPWLWHKFLYSLCSNILLCMSLSPQPEDKGYTPSSIQHDDQNIVVAQQMLLAWPQLGKDQLWVFLLLLFVFFNKSSLGFILISHLFLYLGSLENKETLGDTVYVYFLDHGDGIMGVCIYQNSLNCTH